MNSALTHVKPHQALGFLKVINQSCTKDRENHVCIMKESKEGMFTSHFYLDEFLTSATSTMILYCASVRQLDNQPPTEPFYLKPYLSIFICVWVEPI